MRTITIQDIKSIREYEAIRDTFRSYIIALKRRRRVRLGELVSVVFENRETLLFQIQEVLRAERISDLEAVQAQIAEYAPRVPGPHELSASIFIELAQRETLREDLQRLAGFNRALRLHVGPHVVKGQVADEDEVGQELAVVHYIRFPLTRDQVELFKSGSAHVMLEATHPNYSAVCVLEDQVRAELANDLLDGPPT